MTLTGTFARSTARSILSLLDQLGIDHPEAITAAGEHKAQLNALAADAHSAVGRIAAAIESGGKPRQEDLALAIVAISGKAQTWYDADPVVAAVSDHLDDIRVLVQAAIEKDTAELVQLAAKPHLRDLDTLASADVSGFTAAQFTEYARARQLAEHLELVFRDGTLCGQRPQDRVVIPPETVASLDNLARRTSTLWWCARQGWPLAVRTSTQQAEARAAEQKAITDYTEASRQRGEDIAFNRITR